MTNNRYVILNCPTLMGNRLCYSKIIKQCADCTDCVMKQIVELCKEESSIMQHKQRIKVKGLNKLADKIFELLDIIQEVE